MVIEKNISNTEILPWIYQCTYRLYNDWGCQCFWDCDCYKNKWWKWEKYSKYNWDLSLENAIYKKRLQKLNTAIHYIKWLDFTNWDKWAAQKSLVNWCIDNIEYLLELEKSYRKILKDNNK